MLYVFPGLNPTNLNASGLQHAVEVVESLADLQHDPVIQYRREGVYAVSGTGAERLGPTEYWISPTLERSGLTWRWFPENWTFGNGVTCHKTTANRETMVVDHATGSPIQDLLEVGRAPLDLSKIQLQRVPKPTEGWDKYEARWLPGTCPQESHIVHLTWLVTTHRVPSFALERIRELIESPSVTLRDAERYREKDFSPTRKWTPERDASVTLPLGVR